MGRGLSDHGGQPIRRRGRSVAAGLPDLIPDTPENLMRVAQKILPKRDDKRLNLGQCGDNE